MEGLTNYVLLLNPTLIVQDITTRMSKTRLKVVAMIQRASPPGVMGIDAILKTQEEARQTAILEQQKQEDSGSDPDTDNSDPDTDNSDHDDQRSTQSTLATATSVPSTTYGYIPPPTLIYHIIPGTQATPLAMSTYIQHVFDQALDEMALKEGILEALETIAELKDSGEDELPPLLDQQLTNMVLLWELEPYLDTAPERSEVEATLGVVSWQMEKVK
ncbi:hypothetical protein BGX28_005223 [Mortierella sp. GBA30]|nr:hypothetical protein BGX28_005223 [Mortierella sp. GBA30]